MERKILKAIENNEDINIYAIEIKYYFEELICLRHFVFDDKDKIKQFQEFLMKWGD